MSNNITINIKFTTASFIEDIERNSNLTPNAQVYTNMPARVRMTTLYNVAAMVGGRVINTGNKSEAFVGYTTKYGDLAGDYAVLRDYYVTEIYRIGDALKLPTYLVHKEPADGMSGKTDEDNMGFTYEELDAYLLDGTPIEDFDTFIGVDGLEHRPSDKKLPKTKDHYGIRFDTDEVTDTVMVATFDILKADEEEKNV